MKDSRKMVIVSLTSLLLFGCGEIQGGESLSSSEGASSSKEGTSSSESSPERGEWSEEEKELLAYYCGDVLPYPSGFDGEISVDEVSDDSGVPYLQITDESEAFTLGDYYLELEERGWEAIADYNGEVEQKNSYGNPLVELCKISEDGKKGYDLTYYFYKESEAEADQASTPKYNVIQCYNVFDTALDERAAWSEEEKGTFEAVLTELPPVLKLGSVNGVYASSDDFLYCYDMLAKDLTADNVSILEGAGYELDEKLSEEHSSYVLKKEVSDGAIIYASLYYSSGNIITFAYEAKVTQSGFWPSSFLSSFEESTGFKVPEVACKSYYTYTKGGVCTLCGYTDDSSVFGTFEIAMDETDAVYDMDRKTYSDWEETFYLKPSFAEVAEGKYLFSLSFALLDSPYDLIKEGWPKEEVASFLKESGIASTVPELSFLSASPRSTCRVYKQDYEDMYGKCLSIIENDPSNYLDDPDESSIKALAESMAKERTWLKIKVYDPAVKEGNETHFKANESLIKSLYDAAWAQVECETGIAYEDPEGQAKVTVELSKDVSIVTVSYGSLTPHTPEFAFDESNVDLAPGETYNLQYTLSMLPYEISFSSSDEDSVTVDDKGQVKVKESADPGKVVTITASINVPNEGERKIQCTITVTGSYDAEAAASKVAERYNAHFSLSSEDELAAKPASDLAENPNYVFTVSNPSITTMDQMKQLVSEELIPYGFKISTYTGDWGEGMLPKDGKEIPDNFIEYALYDKTSKLMVYIRFVVYEEDGEIFLKVTTSAF